MVIKLRGHHIGILSLVHFEKEPKELQKLLTEFTKDMGYSEKYIPYVVGQTKKLYDLLENPNEKVEVASGADAICQACPEKTCNIKDSVGEEDQYVLNALGLKPGDKPTINELTQKFEGYKEATGFMTPRTAYTQEKNREMHGKFFKKIKDLFK